MVSHRSCIALAWAAWLPATVAMATQEPPKVQMKAAPPAGEEATVAPPTTQLAPVTVEAAKPAELRKQTYGFVQLYATTTVKLDQLARWTAPVCVTVQGLPADAAAQVRGRVEEVATALKVGAAGAGCRPNVQIMFTDQPQALMDRVAAEHETLLGYWHRRDRNKLKTVTHPVQAWYVTGTGGSGGNVVGMTFETQGQKDVVVPTQPGVFGKQPHGYQLDDEDNRGPGATGCGDRHAFTVCLSSEFEHVMVVVDTSRVQDYTPGLIADYVVMLTMAQPKSLDGCNVLPSVIDLFATGCQGGDGRDGLTRADVAYLTALYKTDLEARKAGQETDIAGRMADMLLKANAADRVAAWGGTAVKASTGR